MKEYKVLTDEQVKTLKSAGMTEADIELMDNEHFKRISKEDKFWMEQEAKLEKGENEAIEKLEKWRANFKRQQEATLVLFKTLNQGKFMLKSEERRKEFNERVTVYKKHYDYSETYEERKKIPYEHLLVFSHTEHYVEHTIVSTLCPDKEIGVAQHITGRYSDQTNNGWKFYYRDPKSFNDKWLKSPKTLEKNFDAMWQEKEDERLEKLAKATLQERALAEMVKKFEGVAEVVPHQEWQRDYYKKHEGRYVDYLKVLFNNGGQLILSYCENYKDKEEILYNVQKTEWPKHLNGMARIDALTFVLTQEL